MRSLYYAGCITLILISTVKNGKAEENESSLFYIFSLNNRFEVKRNFLNSDQLDNLTFSENSTGYYFYAGGSLIWFASDNLNFNLSANTGIVKIKGLYFENGETETTINYKPVSDYARDSLFIDELYMEYENSLQLSVGKKNLSASTDYVFNDYVFFIKSDFHLYKRQKKRLTLELQYNSIDGYFNTDYKGSPMLTLNLSYRNGKLFGLSIFSSLFYDNDNAFGKIYESFVDSFLINKVTVSNMDTLKMCSDKLSECILVDSRGYIIWTGLDLFGKAKGLYYKLVLIGNYGDIDISPYLNVEGKKVNIYAKKKKAEKLIQYVRDKNGDSSSSEAYTNNEESILNRYLPSRKLLGYMFFINGGYKLFESLDISPYFLFMSGENDLEKSGFLNSFISVKSYITLSNIFFSGGLNETASTRNFSMAGVNGKGVINPGIWLKFNKDELPLKVNFGIMKFLADAKNVNGKIDYGTELDFISTYSILDCMDLSLEIDYFIVGNFFRDEDRGIKNPFKILLGVNIFLDNLD
ncbi:MAG: hypothetical protein N2746_04440 [Deltaproteobacteria bacterium]|nr:hypothetical protein [Deltaproteobacteria bacterium]